MTPATVEADATDTLAETRATEAEAVECHEEADAALDAAQAQEEEARRRLEEATEAGRTDAVGQLMDELEEAERVRSRASKFAATALRAREGARRNVRRAQIEAKAQEIEARAPEIQETIAGARSAARELNSRLDELLAHAHVVKRSRRFAEHHTTIGDLQGESLERPDWPRGTHAIGDRAFDLARDIRAALQPLLTPTE